jgi:Methyltransferase domain
VLYFAEHLTCPLLKEAGKKTILEIGSSFGNSIRPILDLNDVEVSIIDPCIDANLLEMFGERIKLFEGYSLDVLPRLNGSFDCIFIDGDHNWYTVFNELKAMERGNLLHEDGIVFLHDIGWPYGRRDMYYQPELIPEEFRNCYARRGIERGQKTLLDSGGANAGHNNALHEGGSRNGVLTAVEDFLSQSNNDYFFVKDFREFGLGILLRKSPRNTWEKAINIKFQILKQTHYDPYRRAVDRRIMAARTSRLANRIRRSRDKFLGRM